MRRLDGNSILIIEDDRNYSEELRGTFAMTGAQVSIAGSVADAVKALESNDFDVILSGHYLPDGQIHHVIDWSKEHLKFLPIFVAIGSDLPADEKLRHRHLISCIFSRTDKMEKLVNGIRDLLFDFKKFYESLHSMIEPRGINMELIVGAESVVVSPIEMTGDGIFFSIANHFEIGTCAILRVYFFEEINVEKFTLIGSLGGNANDGQYFKIDESYIETWNNLLGRLAERQAHITGVLNKATGN